ncbi:hypothetical protein [Deinococcus sp. YIM 77859]|uniref:hypothetical protein n=1 Tax=Deinococcus sp. YIM 77859 TaxID=1540221 RepID=UPI0005529BA2|nr:hypothetical protein [Deinococcus sp. YIM 77859]
MKKMILLAATFSLMLSACAPKYSTATLKPVSEMSCAEMQEDFSKALAVRAEAEKKKGFSKENVAWAIFFFPGAVVNELDNREVIDKADARIAELRKAAPAKGCELKM